MAETIPWVGLAVASGFLLFGFVTYHFEEEQDEDKDDRSVRKLAGGAMMGLGFIVLIAVIVTAAT